MRSDLMRFLIALIKFEAIICNLCVLLCKIFAWQFLYPKVSISSPIRSLCNENVSLAYALSKSSDSSVVRVQLVRHQADEKHQNIAKRPLGQIK